MLKQIIAIVFIAGLISLVGCSESKKEKERIVTVSAAISLKDSFDEIATAYKKKTGIRVRISYGASGSLAQQLLNGAPAEVFASASETEMDLLEAKNLLYPGTRRDFAGNSLVLIVPKDSTLNISNLDQLAGSSVKNIAIGNPSTVPAGRYAIESIKSLGLSGEIDGKLINCENAKQVLDYVSLGEVDAGIAYLTDADVSKASVKMVVNIPDDTHSPIRYPIAVVNTGKEKQEGADFVNFVASTEGQAIIRKYGFTVPTAK